MIGIIAVLVGILLPVLRGAREQARSVQCLAQLRQVGQVVYIYASQNRGMLPPCQNDTVENIVGGTTFILAGASGGGAPPPVSTGVMYPNLRYAFDRILNPGRREPWVAGQPYDPGSVRIFYCPANYLWDGDAAGAGHWPESFMSTGKIKYWYTGNPNPLHPQFHYRGTHPVMTNSQAGVAGTVDWRWWDRNHNGDNRDDYMVKLGDKNAANIAIMTDHSRQGSSGNTTAFGFTFIHGRKPSSGSRITGWKNNLYGDGHAASVRARESSFSADGTQFINPNPGPDELAPGYGPLDSQTGAGIMLW